MTTFSLAVTVVLHWQNLTLVRKSAEIAACQFSFLPPAQSFFRSMSESNLIYDVVNSHASKKAVQYLHF